MLEELPGTFASTRDALHALAEHVLARARYEAEGRIGLVPADGGFGTPVFGDGERVRVDGTELVQERPGTSTRIGITTLGAAARFVGAPLGAPDVYTPATACDRDVPLAVRADAARVLAEWLAFASSLLEELRGSYAHHAPSPATLWPEHFDLSCAIGRADAGNGANFGASPGDGAIAEPYLYVAPWEPERRVGRLGTHPWGAAVTYSELRAGSNPRGTGLEFLFEGAALLFGEP